MTESMKPCPLCGCPIKHGMVRRGRCQLHGDPIIRHRVWCESCGMNVEYGSYELAKKFWNTRAPVRVKLPEAPTSSMFASHESKAEDYGYERALEDCTDMLKKQGVVVDD